MYHETNHLKCNSCTIFFREGEFCYTVGDSLYCDHCINEQDLTKSSGPYIICEQGKYYRVIGQDTLSNLKYGLYTISVCHANWTIIDSYDEINADEDRKSWIKKKIAAQYYVLEKNPLGIMLRFWKTHDKHRFNPDSGLFPTLFRSIDRAGNQGVPRLFLCRDDKIVGVANVSSVQERMDSFLICDGKYEMINESYFKDQMSKAPFVRDISEKMKSIKPVDMLHYFEKRLIGQGGEIKKIVYTFYEYFTRVATGKLFTATNWLLTAPSGCGKTEVYRILRGFCMSYGIPVPVIQVDLSQYTESGYKGEEVEEIIERIMEQHKQTDGIAVCFLDEADKKCLPSYNSKGGNVNAAVQSNLLTLIEGREVTKEGRTFDTNKTMFVLMGAFQSIRNQKQENKAKRTPVGFGVRCSEEITSNMAIERFYDDITLEEIIEYGMLEELAGRLTQIINLHKLSEKDMRVLLAEKTRIISKELDVHIELADEAFGSLLEISYSNLGIRRPMNCIRSLVINTLAEHFFDDDFDKRKCRIVINAADKATITKQCNKKELESSA